MKTIKEALTLLYSEILESYYTENEFKRLRTSMTFYEFIEVKFKLYKEICSKINDKELKILLKHQSYLFNGIASKKRFLNLLARIIESHLKVLQFAYKGDMYTAYRELDDLMYGRKILRQYLVEGIQGYFEGNIESEITLYRMRDSEWNEVPENCWHVPFNLRSKTAFQRYNMNGIPCLYLGDTKETAHKEIGDIEENKRRWLGEFSPQKSIGVFDFTIPSPSQIEKNNDLNTLLGWLLTYPQRLLCSIKVYEKGNFCEEYIYPQLIFHWMYMMPNNKRLDGFKYSSTKNPGGVNYVFPATYETKQPPTYHDKQISERLEKLFTASEPKLYKEGRRLKKYSIEITEL